MIGSQQSVCAEYFTPKEKHRPACCAKCEKMANTSNIFQFFKLMGQLKTTKRTGWVESGVHDPESVSDHMYRMAALAFLVDPTLALEKDRCIKLALVHDMAECIVGDIAPSEGVPKEEKHRREKAAMEHIKGLVPEDAGQELYSLWEDYEFQKSKEAAYVKDLDRFDMVMQAYEYELQDKKPQSLQGFFDSTKDKFHTDQVKSWVAELQQIRGDKVPTTGSTTENGSTLCKTLQLESMVKASNVFQFFKLMGQLKTTKRTGWVERGVHDPESVSDHMYRMAALAFLVDPTLALDRDRCIKLALVHDMAECIVGDIAPSEGIPKEEKYRREKAAMEHIKGLVPADTGHELYSLWEDYEFRKSKEAVYVKDLDQFDMVMQAYEYELQDNKPHSLQDLFDSVKGKFQTDQVKSWVAELQLIRGEKDLSKEDLTAATTENASKPDGDVQEPSEKKKKTDE